MRFSVVVRYVGLILLLNAGFMLLAWVMAWIWGDGGQEPLMYGALISALVGLFPVVFVPGGGGMRAKEGSLVVVCAWLMVCFFGMVPYVLWGGEFDFSAAWFESVSGYTTTGATILDDAAALPGSLQLWRSITHWVGGMGVVLFALVLLPSAGQAQMTLSRTELSAIARQDFRYRSRVMLRVMLGVYVGLTVVVGGGLVAVGIPVFDAVNLSFSTVATGGFAITNESIASYGNRMAEGVIMVGMVAASIHFGLLYGLFSGRSRAFFRSPVLRFFLVVVGGGALMVGTHLFVTGPSRGVSGLLVCLHEALFHVLSVVSTTGFSIGDLSLWPSFPLLVLLLLSHFGGCSGSTASGMKLDRVMIAGCSLRAHILSRQSPHGVYRVHAGDIVLDAGVVSHTLQFLMVYMGLVMIGVLFYTLWGNSLTVGLNLSVASLGNVGLTAGGLSSYDSLSFLPTGCRLLSTAQMLLGRLEIFGLLLIFSPSSWK